MYHVPIGRDLDLFRRVVRRLLALGVPPEGVNFDSDSLFGGEPLPEGGAGKDVRLPKALAGMVKLAAHHRDPDRWALLYRLIRRVHLGQRHVLDLASDDDVVRLMAMEKSVRRDRHKTHAFVRFREVQDEDGATRLVAWYRPDHYSLPLSAPHFVDRYRALHWSILAPDESVTWDGKHLAFGPGVPRDQAPADDDYEHLWRTYYGAIFNPARIKLKAMKAEMPVRFWDVLPETRDMPDLLIEAPRRVEKMVETTRVPESSPADLLPPRDTWTIPTLRAAAEAWVGDAEQGFAERAVFGEGPDDADVVFVGEQPGDHEDRQGRPFVGPAGQLMDQLLTEAGLDRQRIYLTNTVKHFKFEQRGKLRLHRTPSSRDVSAALPWLQAELEVVRPTLLVALGATAAKAIMGRQFRVTQSRGEVMKCRYAEKFMATIHPSAILRIPEGPRQATAKKEFIADMRTVANLHPR